MSAPSAINNARQIIIGKDLTGTVLATTDLTSAAFKAATGEVGVFTKEGTRVNAGNANIVAGMEFVIAVSRGASKSPLVSDLIDASKVTVANALINEVATEQSLAVGYNGTSGLIADVATYAGELYKVSILIHQFLSGTDSEHLKAGYYQSQLTDGQAEIALGIAGSVIKNFSREVSNSDGDKPIIAKVLCNNAGAANTGAGTITVSKGSTEVLFGTNVDAVATVGDYIRFDESAGGATAVTDSVYKIISINAAAQTLTLDRVYGTTSLVAAAEANAVIITAAAGAAANWGVTLTGTPLPFNRDKKRYAKCRFDVVLDTAFGSTAVTTLTSAFEGSGTPEKVAELENFLARMMSESYEMGAPFTFNISDDLLADLSAAGYGVITLKWSQTEVVSFQNEVSPKELILALATPGAGLTITSPYAITATSGLCDILEAIIPAAAQVSADLRP
jgi:hypothetical protein